MKPTILIVDDEPRFVDNFKEMLAMSFDCNILVHPDSNNVFETVQKEPVHVLFQDIHVPGLDGFDVVQQVKKMGKDIEIYVISSWKEDAYPLKCTELGVIFLNKPILPKPLIERLAGLFDRKGLEYKKK